jgi:hypothetical protein
MSSAISEFERSLAYSRSSLIGQQISDRNRKSNVKQSGPRKMMISNEHANSRDMVYAKSIEMPNLNFSAKIGDSSSKIGDS